jgi:hypothetical protein
MGETLPITVKVIAYIAQQIKISRLSLLSSVTWTWSSTGVPNQLLFATI